MIFLDFPDDINGEWKKHADKSSIIALSLISKAHFERFRVDYKVDRGLAIAAADSNTQMMMHFISLGYRLDRRVAFRAGKHGNYQTIKWILQRFPHNILPPLMTDNKKIPKISHKYYQVCPQEMETINACLCGAIYGKNKLEELFDDYLYRMRRTHHNTTNWYIGSVMIAASGDVSMYERLKILPIDRLNLITAWMYGHAETLDWIRSKSSHSSVREDLFEMALSIRAIDFIPWLIDREGINQQEITLIIRYGLPETASYLKRFLTLIPNDPFSYLERGDVLTMMDTLIELGFEWTDLSFCKVITEVDATLVRSIVKHYKERSEVVTNYLIHKQCRGDTLGALIEEEFQVSYFSVKIAIESGNNSALDTLLSTKFHMDKGMHVKMIELGKTEIFLKHHVYNLLDHTMYGPAIDREDVEIIGLLIRSYVPIPDIEQCKLIRYCNSTGMLEMLCRERIKWSKRALANISGMARSIHTDEEKKILYLKLLG
jgi:hypothetical protein